MIDKKTDNMLVVFAIILIGALPRLYSAVTAQYPLHDGGLFFAMIKDIQANGYILPAYTTYNAANIPFAYPPLGFYLAGILTAIGGWSLMDVLRLLPPAISILTIPVFFSFAQLFLKDDALSLFASLWFALIPPIFTWQIMGGGLTRSLGLFFALLTITELYRLTQQPQRLLFLKAGIFISLTLLSHPAAIWFVTYSALFFIIISERKTKSFFRILSAGFVSLLFSSPWWILILNRFGISPFISISGNSFNSIGSILGTLFLRFTSEPFLQIGAVLGLIGLLLCLRNRKIVLPVWVLLISVVQGRGWETYIQVPFTMLIGIGLVELLLMVRPKEITFSESGGGNYQSIPDIIRGTVPKFGLVYILVLGIISAFMSVPKPGLNQAEVDAMQWVEGNVPANSSFALVTGDASDDVIAEWFPAIAGRSSLTTAQGFEWQGNIFHKRISNHNALQACAVQKVDCLVQWSAITNNEIEYVYLVVSQTSMYSTTNLMGALNSSSDYLQIYTSPEVKIFKRTNELQ